MLLHIAIIFNCAGLFRPNIAEGGGEWKDVSLPFFLIANFGSETTGINCARIVLNYAAIVFNCTGTFFQLPGGWFSELSVMPPPIADFGLGTAGINWAQIFSSCDWPPCPVKEAGWFSEFSLS